VKTQRRRVLATGQWALDPAYAVTRNLVFPSDEEFSLRYVYHPFFEARRDEPLEQ
jgi:hypothetical protein